MLHSAKKAQLWHSIWESLECKMMTDVFLCKWIFNSDPDVITCVGQEKICFHFIQGWSRVTSFETLLTSCDSQIILSLGSTTYYVETKYAKRKKKKYFEIDVLVQLIVGRPPRSVCNSHRSLRSYILHWWTAAPPPPPMPFWTGATFNPIA